MKLSFKNKNGSPSESGSQVNEPQPETLSAPATILETPDGQKINLLDLIMGVMAGVATKMDDLINGIPPLPEDKHPWTGILREKIKEVGRVEKEITRNEEMKIAASNDLKIAATPGISVAESRTKILDARLTMDLCDAKDNVLFEEITRAKADLLQTTKDAAARYNFLVYRERNKARAKIVAAQSIAFGGPDAVRDHWNKGGQTQVENSLMRFEEYEFSHVPFMRSAADLKWSEKNVARLLIAKIERHAEVLGIDLKGF